MRIHSEFFNTEIVIENLKEKPKNTVQGEKSPVPIQREKSPVPIKREKTFRKKVTFLFNKSLMVRQINYLSVELILRKL